MLTSVSLEMKWTSLLVKKNVLTNILGVLAQTMLRTVWNDHKVFPTTKSQSRNRSQSTKLYFLCSPIVTNKFECSLPSEKCNNYNRLAKIMCYQSLVGLGPGANTIKEISSKKYLKLFAVSLSSFDIRLLNCIWS
jgi:hypothetical protein